MSEIKSSVKSANATWNFRWKTMPRGSEGSVEVEVTPGQWEEVHWRKDVEGIWISRKNGASGFDLQRKQDDDSRFFYHISQRGSFHEWTGVYSTLGEDLNLGTKSASQNKAIRVRAQMPGKIIRIPIEVGQAITKGQPLIVLEAMKMENEIRAAQSGKISQIKVTEGQTVESGADLVLLEPV